MKQNRYLPHRRQHEHSIQWLMARDIYMYAQEVWPGQEGFTIGIRAAHQLYSLEVEMENDAMTAERKAA